MPISCAGVGRRIVPADLLGPLPGPFGPPRYEPAHSKLDRARKTSAPMLITGDHTTARHEHKPPMNQEQGGYAICAAALSLLFRDIAVGLARPRVQCRGEPDGSPRRRRKHSDSHRCGRSARSRHRFSLPSSAGNELTARASKPRAGAALRRPAIQRSRRSNAAATSMSSSQQPHCPQFRRELSSQRSLWHLRCRSSLPSLRTLPAPM